jgi:hypothetical protein
MVGNDPVVDFFAWLLFALVVVWALWRGLWNYAEHHSDGREDLRLFPDELAGEPGPGMMAVARGERAPRIERSRRQANNEGDGRVVAMQEPGSVLRDSGSEPRRRAGRATGVGQVDDDRVLCR